MFSFAFVRARTTLVLGAVLCAALVGLAAGTHSRQHTLIAHPQSATQLGQEPAPASAQTARVEVEIITIHPTGFEPVEITRPAGRVLLAVNNSTGLDEVTLRLAREDGEQLYEAHVPRNQRNWRQPVELTSGIYLLTEANHPDWVCRIVITN